MAQEVTFMMLRVVLFEIYKSYRLRIAPGATVKKNAIVTTKPASVPVIRLPRDRDGRGRRRPRCSTAPPISPRLQRRLGVRRPALGRRRAGGGTRPRSPRRAATAIS